MNTTKQKIYCSNCKIEITGRGKHGKCKKCVFLGENNPNYGNPSERKSPYKGTVGILHANTIFPSKSGKNNPMYGVTRTGKLSGFFGKRHTEETKKKKRIAMIEYIKKKKGGISPNYNINSIKIIEQYGKEHGYNFQHAENGGEFYIKELGYWVDGYDKEKNVIIEYYEPYHKSKKERDEIRKNEITSLLNCTFIELKSWELLQESDT